MENRLEEIVNRPRLPRLFIDTAIAFSKRSTCLRRAVGAVLVKDDRIIGEGYNGPVSGQRHCNEVGCLREKYGIQSGERSEMCVAVHAEQNIISYCARKGIATEGSELYITLAPCSSCARSIIVAGIQKVVYLEDYPEEVGVEILNNSRIEVIKYDFISQPQKEPKYVPKKGYTSFSR